MVVSKEHTYKTRIIPVVLVCTSKPFKKIGVPWVRCPQEVTWSGLLDRKQSANFFDLNCVQMEVSPQCEHTNPFLWHKYSLLTIDTSNTVIYGTPKQFVFQELNPRSTQSRGQLQPLSYTHMWYLVRGIHGSLLRYNMQYAPTPPLAACCIWWWYRDAYRMMTIIGKEFFTLFF